MDWNNQKKLTCDYLVYMFQKTTVPGAKLGKSLIRLRDKRKVV